MFLMGMCDPKAIRNGKAWADVVNKTPMNPVNKCNGCVHAINPQGYFHACNSPAKLNQFKRFYYVERMPDGSCYQGTT
jgi:hypothetical protein